MKRRDFIKTISAGGAVATLSTSSSRSFSQQSRKKKPNIIFIMADDLGYGDVGCYGQTRVQTPNIDRLAAGGLRFTQAYAGAPVCTPSRSVLMTGLHNGHTPARDNIPHYHTYLEENDVTIAEVLKQAGYTCGGVGKWSLGDAGTVGRATNQGFDTWFGYLNQDHAHYYYTEYLDDDEGRLDLSGNTKTHEHYSHDLMTERALKFINQNQDNPFFLYAAYTIPHFSSKDEDPDGLAVPSTEPYADHDWEEHSKKYAAMVHRLDRDVGRIMSRIKELGLDENTLIIFTSDNGGHASTQEQFNSNGPLQGSKRNLTEGGIRVPFIAHWPGVVPAGETSSEIITFWDMMPTFAELAGTKAPPNIDGLSVVNALQGKPLDKTHEYLYWDYGHCRDRYDQAVRMGKWKGIRLGQGSNIQLYDIESDIGETNNIADQHPDIVKKMDEIMKNAVTPSDKYPIGEKYQGSPIWKKDPKAYQ